MLSQILPHQFEQPEGLEEAVVWWSKAWTLKLGFLAFPLTRFDLEQVP